MRSYVSRGMHVKLRENRLIEGELTWFVTGTRSRLMPEMLASYVTGEWYTAPDGGATVVDAATGDPVARVSTTGLDTRKLVEHARRVGGPALRGLTFQERAAALRDLATYLDARKAAYHELSLATGATRRDATGDIDGGIGTTFVFSSRGRRELPDGYLLTDGDLEPVGKAGTFVGQHVYTSLRGVVLQVNAFNFPVWGMLEKLAPAVLAGVPTIVKPATQTAYLTAAVMRDVIASGALPEGAVQFVCGGFQRRDRLAQLLDPRTGRRHGDTGIRPLRQGDRSRDHHQGGTAVHVHPPRARPRVHGRRRDRRAASAARQRGGRQPTQRHGDHGGACQPPAAR